MKNKTLLTRLTAVVLSLVLMLSLAACGSTPAQESETTPSETLKGIYDALIAPDSDYSENKVLMTDFYPELEYSETLGIDRITITFKANGNVNFTDGSWEFVQDGDRVTAVIADGDHTGVMYMIYVANAIGSYFGMEPTLVSGYLNGLSVLGAESDNFSTTRDEAAGTTTYSLNMAGPWDMKELDQMVLTEAVLDAEPLDENYTSQGGNVGKLMYLANGNVSSYTALLAEYGELDDAAYQSIVNLVTLRKPTGWEAFLADFTELKDLETDDYSVKLDPDDETITEIMGERNDKYSYVLLRFGSEENYEEDYVASVPDAETFADAYFRAVAGIPQGTAGASLTRAQVACDVLNFAFSNELWLPDTEILRANMLEAWESLTVEERANFDANFPEFNELMNGCFEDWETNRSHFEDAGVAETMEELMANGTAQWSWVELSANTWTLGNSED